MSKVFAHLRAQWAGFLALFIVIAGGTAYAADTVFSSDIVDGEVKTADLATSSVRTQEIVNGQVANADLRGDAVDSSKVLNDSLTGLDIQDESLNTTKLADGGINTSDLAISSVTGSRIYPGSVTSSDIANRTVDADDLDGSDRSGSIDIGAISNGRCVTYTGNVSGARPGDVALLTTNGTIPSGMTISAQRALTDAVHIKVCNLSGATSAAINDLPVRVLTIH
jgi:hypothetical protein